MADNNQDQLLDHDYDGIREYDNRLPNWWLYTLYGSIVFAVLYWVWLHTWGFGLQQEARYQAEMRSYEEAQAQAAEAAPEQTNASLAAMTSDTAKVAAGQQIFTQFCVACHQADGSGLVGPNLTDAYWIHGGRPLDIVHTITYGVPEKGMVAWGPQLGPKRIEDVAVYVLTLKGKNLPGKAPEGELESPPAAGEAGETEAESEA
jgi:cytochrome c oxidase cbb3-type subunit 3